MLQQKLMFGLGLWAATSDADGAGYLDSRETLGVQQLRQEFAAYCNGLAAEYLNADSNPSTAKQSVRIDFASLGSHTETGSFSLEEAVMIDGFVSKLDVSIDRLAPKSDWYRTFALWEFRTPHWIKAWMAAAIVSGVAISVILAFTA